MEIKATLQKPYTENQRMDFIVDNNHKLGYEIKEAETELQAWGYTEEEKAEQEQEHIKMLSCTKRDFALLLQEQGITYTQLKALIAQNEQAQMEWELCERLYRFNPLLDIMGAQLGVSSETLDYIFRKANSEITEQEFRGA